LCTKKGAIRHYEKHGLAVEGRDPRDMKFGDGKLRGHGGHGPAGQGTPTGFFGLNT
jgi:hypothetical protein